MASRVPYKTRYALKDRAKGRCELCGLVIYGSAHVHHRQPRGMGGSGIAADPHRMSNLMWLHPGCHLRRVELNREEAYENGWLVRSVMLARMVPVRMWDGWWHLDDDGGIAKADPP